MKQLNQIIESEYGVNPFYAPTYVVIWAVSKISDKELAKLELKKHNSKRQKLGCVLAYAPYGSHAF